MARRHIWLGKSGKNILCCSGRPNTCNNFTLLSARSSDFHPDPLKTATDEINAILANVREQAPAGLHLAMIDTRDGMLLIYAEAGDRPDDISDFVRYESDVGAIREFLGIPEPPTEATAA